MKKLDLMQMSVRVLTKQSGVDCFSHRIYDQSFAIMVFGGFGLASANEAISEKRFNSLSDAADRELY